MAFIAPGDDGPLGSRLPSTAAGREGSVLLSSVAAHRLSRPILGAWVRGR